MFKFFPASSVPHLSAMVDQRFEPVQFVRPFRNVSNRELSFLAHNNVEENEGMTGL